MSRKLIYERQFNLRIDQSSQKIALRMFIVNFVFQKDIIYIPIQNYLIVIASNFKFCHTNINNAKIFKRSIIFN